jgi:Protein of unknown function (DUF4232)
VIAHVPPVAPPCRLSQLQVGTVDPHLGVFFNGATGSLVGWVSFANEGAACSLLGRPRVRLVGGPSPAVKQRETTFTGGKHAPVRVLRHGHAAGVEIWWSNWCAPHNRGDGKLSSPPTGLVLTLPSGGTVRLTVREAPRCDQPQQPSLVSVGTFHLAAGK